MKDFFFHKSSYVILFFGPDGSGKSTLAQSIADELRRRELPVKVSWMRGSHTVVSLVAPFLSMFQTFKGADNPYYHITIPSSMKRFWQTLEFLSAIPIILCRYVLLNLSGISVVGERCFLDLVVWVAIVTRDESYLNRFSSRFLNCLALKSYARVYVTADLNTLLKRRNDVSAEMLSKQQKLYRKISITSGAFTLDTTGKTLKESAHLLKIMLKI